MHVFFEYAHTVHMYTQFCVYAALCVPCFHSFESCLYEYCTLKVVVCKTCGYLRM